jgi:hypothetical protein
MSAEHVSEKLHKLFHDRPYTTYEITGYGNASVDMVPVRVYFSLFPGVFGMLPPELSCFYPK